MNDSAAIVLPLASTILFVVVYVWLALALSAVFRKAGEQSWKAWVPIVSSATVLKLGGFSPWLVLINLVPIFGALAFFVLWAISLYRVSAAFGSGGGMAALGFFFPYVWASILGFGDARWQGAERPSAPDDAAPVRRRGDFDGPYVPLVGGWTPPAPDDLRPEPDPAPAPSAAAASVPDVAPAPSAPAPASAPVAVPFAAPTVPLADAVPAPLDWAPPSREPAPATSVFDALDTMRDSAPADDEPPYTAVPVEAPPVSHVPSRAEVSDDGIAPWADVAPRAPRQDAPAAADPIASVPLTRPAAPPAPVPSTHGPLEPGDDFPEPSEAVSAVVGAPDAGAPRSARTSVSALYTQPEVPGEPDDDLEAMDRTVVARRRRIPWALVPPSGPPVELTSSVVILGRRPAPDPARPDAQLVSISDETRTVSKTHARLELRADTWYVTDLDSTNGVLFATLMGTEVEAPPGEEIEAGERFFLGDAEVRLSRREV